MHAVANALSNRQVLRVLPSWLRRQLTLLHRELGGELYLAGGVVRDLLLGKVPADIDLTMPERARVWAGKLAVLTGGALVPLGREEDAARVVCRRTTIDFSSFRQGARTIAEDLIRRDLSVNALALRLDPWLNRPRADDEVEVPLIDPTGGLADLRHGLIRVASAESFTSDPLRLLRVFRFAATLEFAVEAATFGLVHQHCRLITQVAPERIAYELDCIVAAPDVHGAIRLMAESGLLWQMIPELAAGVGMEQPKSHHLDVWLHNLETLRQMERIIAEPSRYFPEMGERMAAYLAGTRQPRRLKWAALLHDLGKPATFALRADKGDRITFYNHDLIGARMFNAFALRLRWSNEERASVGRLIAGHMRPFHLANVARAGNLSSRAAIRMIRQAGGELPGLFLLAMADSLAGQGVERLEGMEGELAELYRQLEQIRSERVAPVQAAVPLLTGRDLIEVLHLQPGPVFKKILAAVEEAQMTGEVDDVNGAMRLAKKIVTDISVES
ncbi:HDIG domain-containing metalloprotein [uncultured Desulfobulbus sp.]|uniref:HDIG domain-containing metalloprotein n=1 Tax=uncultured Desulfobulbus sp. TaxID=239745 RepID=UPI0029C709D7|nr:HDIG domain-containing metalloprotein [uncultured Desulfobulbus sp.]